MIDQGSNYRSGECASVLQAFNINNGTLQFNTHCASSRNTWMQRIRFKDWGKLLEKHIIYDEDIIEKFSHLILGQNDVYDLLQKEEIEEIKEEDILEYVVDETERGEPLSMKDIGDMTFDDLKSMMPEVVNLDMKVTCNCPAFLYWGSAYIMDLYDSGEESLPRYLHPGIPEMRYPQIRDPMLQRGLCKHLISVINHFFR